jgi:hypothetical protein
MALSRAYQRLRLKDLKDLKIESDLLASDFSSLFAIEKVAKKVDKKAAKQEEPLLCALGLLRHLVQRRGKIHLFRRKSRTWNEISNLENFKSHFDSTPKAWLSYFSIRDREILSCFSLRTVLENFDFIGLPGGIQDALNFWINHPDSMDLLDSAPSPLEMLEMQSQGRRCVVFFTSASDLSRTHSGKEPFEFLLHDLEHAQKFFLGSGTHVGQTKFFQFISDLYNKNLFSNNLARDAIFAEQFNYLISDMNSHPEHLRKYLEAIHLNSLLRLRGLSSKDPLSDEDIGAQNRIKDEFFSCFPQPIETHPNP